MLSLDDRTVLADLAPGHPRLMMDEASLASLRAALEVGRDAALARSAREVRAKADRMLAASPLGDGVPPEKGARGARECLRRVWTLGLLYRLTGETRYAAAAADAARRACAFDDWWPAHGLEMAEMAHAVGLAYDWLYGYLDEDDRETLRNGLVRKALAPADRAFETDAGPRWMNNILRAFNWNLVCNGGLVVAALAVAEARPRLAARIVRQAVEAMPVALANYAPDGAWGEGPGYWSYGTRYAIYALAALESALGTDFGLGASPGLARTGRFPVLTTGPTGRLYNFADCPLGARRGALWPLFWLARRYADPLLAEAEHAVLAGGEPAAAEHLVFYAPLAEAGPWPRDVLFGGDTPVVAWRSAWDDPDALFLAAKGGANRINHGQLDLGSFVLEALGVRWAHDLGRDDYGLPGYWDRHTDEAARWRMFRHSSPGHNVTVLGGANQQLDGWGRVVDYEEDPDGASVVFDLSSAYEGAREVRRALAMVDGRRAVLVEDAFDLTRPADLTWGMITKARVTPSDGGAALEEDGRRLHLRVLEPTGARVTAESAERDPPEAPNEGMTRVRVDTRGGPGPVTIAVKLEPEW